MKIDVRHRPSYALAVVALDPDETVVAESGSMVSMDSQITVETSAGRKDEGLVKGLFAGLKRLVAGESFFQNRYTAKGRAGSVTFAPTHVGDICTHTLSGGVGLMIQSKSYLCSAPTVDVDAKWGGASSFFGGEGLIMLKATGSGEIAFNAFGGVKLVELPLATENPPATPASQPRGTTGEFIVDTGHIVAFEDTLTFKVTRFGGGWKAFIFGGEGLVCHFSGTGKLWIQTRNPQGFGEAIGPLLPMREG